MEPEEALRTRSTAIRVVRPGAARVIQDGHESRSQGTGQPIPSADHRPRRTFLPAMNLRIESPGRTTGLHGWFPGSARIRSSLDSYAASQDPLLAGPVSDNSCVLERPPAQHSPCEAPGSTSRAPSGCSSVAHYGRADRLSIQLCHAPPSRIPRQLRRETQQRRVRPPSACRDSTIRVPKGYPSGGRSGSACRTARRKCSGSPGRERQE